MAISSVFRYVHEAITVPYPPNFDAGRTNAGFQDLHGHPELVSGLHEAQNSRALALLLKYLATSLIWRSIGCDLGEHVEEEPSRTRYAAGGYLQISAIDFDTGSAEYEQAGERVYRILEKAADTKADWRLVFEISPLQYNIGDISYEIGSLWIWFQAFASSRTRAAISREKLLTAVRRGL